MYDKANTHFNAYGSFISCSTLINEIRKDFPQLPELSLDDYEIEIQNIQKDELTRMLNITRNDTHIALTKKGKVHGKLIPSNIEHNSPNPNYIKHYTSNLNNVKVILFGDSFTGPMAFFLKECFGDLIRIRSSSIDEELVELIKPDIIIQEVVERNIDHLFLGKYHVPKI